MNNSGVIKSYMLEREARNYAQQLVNRLGNDGNLGKACFEVRYASGEKLPWQVWATIK